MKTIKLIGWVLWAIFTWALYLAVTLPLWLLGWVVVPVLLLLKKVEWRQSKKWTYGVAAWTPKFAYLWGNEENGVFGYSGTPGQQKFWTTRTALWSPLKIAVAWSANRNPTNNLRFIKPFGFDPNGTQRQAGRRDEWGSAWTAYDPNSWFFVRSGLYTAFYFARWGLKFRIGWNIEPRDCYFPVEGYRAKGAGFKLQLKRL